MRQIEAGEGILGFHKDVHGNMYFPTKDGNTFLYKQNSSELEVLPPKEPSNKIYFIEENVQWLSYILDSPDDFKNQKIISKNRMKIAKWEYKPLLLELLFIDKDGCFWFDAELRETHYLACYDGAEMKKLITGITNFSAMDYIEKGFVIGTSSEFVRIPGINPIAQGIYLVDLGKFTYELVEVPKTSLDLGSSTQIKVYKRALNLPDEIPASVYAIFRKRGFKDTFYLISNLGLLEFNAVEKKVTPFNPKPPANIISLVSSNNKIIASGQKQIMHYDGTQWIAKTISPLEYFDFVTADGNKLLLSSFNSSFIYETSWDEAVERIVSDKGSFFD